MTSVKDQHNYGIFTYIWLTFIENVDIPYMDPNSLWDCDRNKTLGKTSV